MQKEFHTFTVMHPVPAVRRLTVGEYADMINGKGWMPAGKVPYERIQPVK